MKNEYEVKYKILINFLTELMKKSYVSKEDIEFLLNVLEPKEVTIATLLGPDGETLVEEEEYDK